jgi:hypothetical protein
MRGKLKIWLVLVAIFFAIIPAALGQYVKIGDGSFAGTLGGPMVASTTKDTQVSRFAYIFPKAAPSVRFGFRTHRAPTLVQVNFTFQPKQKIVPSSSAIPPPATLVH